MIKSKRRHKSNLKQWLSKNKSCVKLMERIKSAYPDYLQVKVYQERNGIIIDIKIVPAVGNVEGTAFFANFDLKSFDELVCASEKIFEQSQDSQNQIDINSMSNNQTDKES